MENREKQEAAEAEHEPSQSPPVSAGATDQRDAVDEKPGASLHSRRKPSRFGRHSLDVRTKSDRSGIASPAGKQDRSHSLPGHSDDSDMPDPSLPAHSPTTTLSPRQNTLRSSTEFDRRFDGPFARPSIAMVRQRSSQQARVEVEHGVGAADEAIAANVAPSAGSAPELLEPEPPPLNYTLRTRKRYIAIFIFWTFIVFDSVVIPIALYYGLWYGVGPGSNTPTKKNAVLSANAVFSIVTAAIGGASILEYCVRFWRLWKKNSTCRVIGARRWYLDWFHWNYSLGWIIVMVELIVGTSMYWPPIRLIAMPLTTMLFTFGTELLIVDALRLFRVPSPCRMSSIPKGAQLRPCIYTMIEDICAVDGSGGTAFREALNRRYEASHVFRTMLRQLGVFWAVGAESTAVMCTILIFTLDDDTAYTIGWSVPFAWAGIWALCTIWYVKRALRREKAAWAEEASKHTA